MHDNVSHRIRLSHEMKHALVFAELEIEVDLGTTIMQMRWHRVPYASRIEDSKTKQKLRRTTCLRNHVLVDCSVIRLLERTQFDGHRIFDRDLDDFEACMRRCGSQVELRRLGRIVA